MSAQDYDKVPYGDQPYHGTRPENLFLMASLFGFPAQDFRRAKVLELGCASGANIVPLAEHFPQCEFVGVDYSQRQIAEGQKYVDQLDVDNIRLENISILDITAEFGQFDYIIAHGLYSWVSPEIQQKLLEVCRNNLSPNGVAFVSYNTKPGWNIVQSYRDMMQYHTREILNLVDKAQQGRELINFVQRNVVIPENPWAKLLLGEINHQSFSKDYYLIHDHLEDYNLPVYFHEFAARLKDLDLQYITDIEYAHVNPYLLPDEARKTLLAIDDKIVAEQYLDFIHNRRFRQSVICRKDHDITRFVSGKYLEHLAISSQLVPEHTIDLKTLSNRDSLVFRFKELRIEVIEPAFKFFFSQLYQAPSPVPWDQLVDYILQQNVYSSRQAVLDILNSLQFSQLLSINAIAFHIKPYQDQQQPVSLRAPQYARYQCQQSSAVTNKHHQLVEIGSLGRILLPLLNGEIDWEELKQKFSVMITDSEENAFELTVNNQLQQVDKEVIVSNIDAVTQHYLQVLSNQGLLL